MKTRLLVPIAALALFASACGDSPADPGTASNNSAESYWPATKGSTWTYAGPVPYTITVLGDTTIAGKLYSKMHSTAASAPFSLMRQSAGIYYQVDAGNLAVERIFLKDNVPVGEKWILDYPAPTGIPQRAEYTVAAIGASRTVAGNSFTNVIHLHGVFSMQNPNNGEWVTYTDGEYYYSKGVGMIEADLGSLGVTTLTSYSIK